MSQKNPKKASGPFIWRGPFIERTLYLGGGVYPLFEVILGHFGHLLGFPVKTVCNLSLPRNPSQQRKRYTAYDGVISELLQRVDLGLRHAGRPKSTLGNTSEMTPMGGIPFSLQAWIPWEVRIAHRFQRKPPKSAQNRDTPLF